jgi:thioredoxin 1
MTILLLSLALLTAVGDTCPVPWAAVRVTPPWAKRVTPSPILVPNAPKPYLAVWTADWCVPCKLLHPVIDSLYAEGYDVRYHNADTYATTAKAWGVRALPTMILVQDGVEIARLTGYRDHDAVVGLFNKQRDAKGR